MLQLILKKCISTFFCLFCTFLLFNLICLEMLYDMLLWMLMYSQRLVLLLSLTDLFYTRIQLCHLPSDCILEGMPFYWLVVYSQDCRIKFGSPWNLVVDLKMLSIFVMHHLFMDVLRHLVYSLAPIMDEQDFVLLFLLLLQRVSFEYLCDLILLVLLILLFCQ